MPGMYTIRGFKPSTRYYCSLTVYNFNTAGPISYTTFTTKADYIFIQIILKATIHCPQWVERNTERKLTDIATEVEKNVCIIGLNRMKSCYVVKEIFNTCIKLNEEDLVTFRAELRGTAECSSSCLIHKIKTWVSIEQVVTVYNMSMTVQDIKANCTVLPSLQDKTCFSNESPIANGCNNERNVIIIGIIGPVTGSVAGSLVTALITRKFCKKSRGVKRPSNSTSHGSTDSGDLSPDKVSVNSEPDGENEDKEPLVPN
jgi:hypothetical protein